MKRIGIQRFLSHQFLLLIISTSVILALLTTSESNGIRVAEYRHATSVIDISQLNQGLYLIGDEYIRSEATPTVASFEALNHKLAEPLSVREADVLRMLFAGKSNVEIGEELFISVEYRQVSSLPLIPQTQCDIED